MTRTCGNCQHGKFDAYPLGNCSASVATLAHERSGGIPCVRSYAVLVERTADASRCPDWQKLSTPKTHRGNPDSKTGGDSTSPVREKRGRVGASKGNNK